MKLAGKVQAVGSPNIFASVDDGGVARLIVRRIDTRSAAGETVACGETMLATLN